jgi:hypothetical protein
LFTTTCKPLVIWLLPAPVFGLPVRFLASVVIPWKDKTAYSRQVPSYHSRWTQNSTIHIYSPRSLSGFIDSSDWFKVHVTEKPWSFAPRIGGSTGFTRALHPLKPHLRHTHGGCLA